MGRYCLLAAWWWQSGADCCGSCCVSYPWKRAAQQFVGAPHNGQEGRGCAWRTALRDIQRGQMAWGAWQSMSQAVERSGFSLGAPVFTAVWTDPMPHRNAVDDGDTETALIGLCTQRKYFIGASDGGHGQPRTVVYLDVWFYTVDVAGSWCEHSDLPSGPVGPVCTEAHYLFGGADADLCQQGLQQLRQALETNKLSCGQRQWRLDDSACKSLPTITLEVDCRVPPGACHVCRPGRSQWYPKWHQNFDRGSIQNFWPLFALVLHAVRLPSWQERTNLIDQNFWASLSRQP